MSFLSIVRDVRDTVGSFSRRSFDVRVSNGTTHQRSKSHGVEAHIEDLIVIKNTRWANLPAALLRDVMKKLDESESTWPARKQVVACAGVCKTWRLMCKDIVKSPEFPGPRDGIIQCYIKRDKSNMTYHLYLSLSPAILVESGKFLLSAKRSRRATYTEYVISMDADNISRSSSTYIGKLKSNFLGTKFIVYDTAPAYNSSQILSPPNRSRSFNSKKVSPKVPSGSYNIAQVTYELNLLGTRGPRRMNCIMHSIPSLALEPGGTVPSQPEFLQRSLDESFRSIGSSKIVNHSGDFTRPKEEEGKVRPLVLKTKPPRWLQPLRCWCLNFKGRVTVASVKNFQLMSAATVQPGSGSDGGALATRPSLSPQQPEQSNHDKIILHFGKVGKDMFTMDYRYPLSAFQAFAISLSTFDTKLACE
ncbi:Tubby-like F-box protein 5 [Arabidopsis thaliana]